MRSLPRVLLVAPHFPPETVAGAARMAALARDLRALGHDVVVVAPGPEAGEGPEVARAGDVRRPKGTLGNALWQLRLGRALARAAARAPRPDVAIVSTPPPLAALVAARELSARGLRVVLDVRDIWPDVLIEAGALAEISPGAAALRAVDRALLARACAVVTVTQRKRERLSGRFSGEIVVGSNGVDEAWLAGAPLYEGGSDDDFVALCAGNVGLAQGVPSFVSALSVHRSPQRAVRGVVLGDGEDMEAAQALAKSLGAPVAFEGVVPREEVRRRLASCGCAVVTLRSAALADSVPSKLLEAMALGVPVAAAVSGEAADIVAESGGGIAVAPGDEAALRGALEDLRAAGRARRCAMGARGRAHVLKYFRRESSASQVSSLLVRVC